MRLILFQCRRGGFLPGAAAFLASGGVGATAPTISPQCFHVQPGSSGLAEGMSGKVRVMSDRFYKNVPVVICECRKFSHSAAEDSEKSLTRLLRIPKNLSLSCGEFQKMCGPQAEDSGNNDTVCPREQGSPACFTSGPPCMDGKQERPYWLTGIIHRHDLNQKAPGTNEKNPG